MTAAPTAVAGAVVAHGSVVQHGLLVLAATAAATAYVACWWRRPTATLWPVAAFLAGIVATVAAAAPPMERVAERTFTGHMVQHLLLFAVAAPLLVAARPGRVVRRARRPGAPSPRRPAWLERVPLAVAPAVAVGLLYVVHLTPVYDTALRHQLVHDGEHVLFLVSGLLLWGAVLGPGQQRAAARVMTAFATIGALAFLSMVLSTARAPIGTAYADRMGVADALADQRLGASLMWVGGMVLTLPLLLVAAWRWAAGEERRVRRAEQLARSAGSAGSAGSAHLPVGTRRP